MALANGTLFNVTATATTGNVNGGGFNPANANFVTDWTVDSGTGNTSAPVISSATLSLASGDSTAWIYVKSGTNWNVRTWYPISSISGGKATINAAIGAGFTQDALNPAVYTATTVAGIATVGTPTGGTIGFDFSFADTAAYIATDFGQAEDTAIVISATAGFRRTMVGNVIHRTTVGNGSPGYIGWEEIVSYTNATTVVISALYSGGGGDAINQTGYVGGAGRLNGLEDAMLEALPLGGQVWVKSGTYTISGAVSVVASNGTTAVPNWIIGYTTKRGDSCTGSNRPLIVCGANTFVLSAKNNLSNFMFTTTAAAGVTIGGIGTVDNCSCVNTSATAGRVAWTALQAGTRFIDCEGVSQNGVAFSSATSPLRVTGCYAHDSDIGIQSTSGVIVATRCKLEACRTAAFNTACLGSNQYTDCTIYGCESQIGIGARFTGAASTGHQIANCIFYGLATGISCGTQQGIDQDYMNVFYNCGTNVTNWLLEPHSLTMTNPGFTGAAQATGSTATTSGSVLTQSGGDFSTVTDNVDYLHVISGTGVTVGRYQITGHTSATVTVNNALGTSSAGNVVYFVTTGHNLQIGAALKGLGGPNFSNMGIEDRSYLDPGCMQREEVAASGGLFRPAMFTGGFAQ